MARKKKEKEEATPETNEEVVSEEATTETNEEVVEKSPEELAIEAALATDDPKVALAELSAVETTDEVLKTVIGTYLALSEALGDEAPATQHALTNLSEFKPAKRKKPKAKKAPKFNEVKILRGLLANEDETEALENVKGMLDDEQVSEELKVVITTYFTLADLGDAIAEPILANALINLKSFGRKRKVSAGGTQSRVDFHVQVDDDKIYTTLCGALAAQGHAKADIVTDEAGKERSRQDIAWRAIRPKLLSEGSVEFDGSTYKSVPLSDDAIQAKRAPKPAAEVVEESTESTEDS